jgi:oligoribonuclease NrnB/cAMP/cGMP phosphodiesterase (DHH superfamily)
MADIDILYDDDLDGITAAHAAWLWAIEEDMEANVAAIGHGDRDGSHEELLSENSSTVVLLDWPSWEPERFFEVGREKDLIVIDHHETILNWAEDPESRGVLVGERTENGYSGMVRGEASEGEEGEFELVLDLERSAAPLTWEYFSDFEVPRLYEHVEDRDLWKWEMEGSEEILLGLRSQEVTINWIDHWAYRPGDLKEKGEVIRSYQEKLLSDHESHVTIAETWIGEEGPFVTGHISLPHLRSEMADILLRENEGLDLAIIYNHTGPAGEEDVICSIRSRPDNESIPVGDLAEKVGGGGHPCAGGFKVPAEAVTRHHGGEEKPQVKFHPVKE